jgi:hypothetical protein
MNNILKQKTTYIYLSISIVMIFVALIVGIDDNPPGIIIFFLGSIVLVIAFTHKWEKAKPYLFLVLFSLLGLVISGLLHNVFEAIGGEGTILGIVGAMFFLIAIFICPACLLVGIVGSMVRTFKKVEAIKN